VLDLSLHMGLTRDAKAHRYSYSHWRYNVGNIKTYQQASGSEVRSDRNRNLQTS